MAEDEVEELYTNACSYVRATSGTLKSDDLLYFYARFKQVESLRLFRICLDTTDQQQISHRKKDPSFKGAITSSLILYRIFVFLIVVFYTGYGRQSHSIYELKTKLRIITKLPIKCTFSNTHETLV